MDLNLDFTMADNQTPSTAGRYLAAIVTGQASEFALFGIRGDGKTIASLAAIVAHAQRHEQAGYPLPVPWMGVRDTFANHKLTTVKSLQNPLWGGCWELREDNHLAVFKAGPKEYKPYNTLDRKWRHEQQAMHDQAGFSECRCSE